MSSPVKFLTSLGQVMATMALYNRGHPARERALDDSYQELQDVLNDVGRLRFSFIGGDVVFERRVVRELKDWDWATRLADMGIERLEIDPTVTRDDYEQFLRDTFQRSRGEAMDTAEVRHIRETGIRYGTLALDTGETLETSQATLATATIAYSLRDDVEAIQWMHARVQESGELPLLEAETVVRSLAIAMHSQSEIIVPLLQLKEFDQYTTTHSTNVSVLAMALGEYLGFGGRELRVLGVSGLLHDLGKVKIPREILVKPGGFTDEEFAIMKAHPKEGAKLILDRDVRLEVPAVVAYEHHIMLNGGGYPAFHFLRDTHYASRLVHVCDVYDALCTNRPYREAWASSKALDYLEEKSGTDFDPAFSRPFIAMMKARAVRRLSLDDPEVRPDANGSGSSPGAAP
ncbi:MAG TPA: HD domain-containing phosphohydrolase [Gemmatimonadales bacterium]|nr:HD domain-containing phosphohydrolase [Gemmatimonadales bacterium]